MNDTLPILLARVHDLWYALPLIVAVSMVYSATRHEAMSEILNHAGRVAIWIGGFMLVVLGVLSVIDWLL